MSTHDFKDLQVWQHSMDLVELVYAVVSMLPSEEKFALADQMRRSAISVPSNIAEGQKRANNKETVQFTYIALGSIAELETQLIICYRLYGLEVSACIDKCQIVGRMLTALARSIKERGI